MVSLGKQSTNSLVFHIYVSLPQGYMGWSEVIGDTHKYQFYHGKSDI